MADTNTPQGKVCSGDCFGCSFQQAWMCTSQHTLRILKAMNGMVAEIESMKKQVTELQEKFADTPEPPIQQEESEPESTGKNK
jgi:hypothetical protein